MAKHIYVSSIIAGGATGDTSYGIQQVGAMSGLTSTNVYNTLEDAILGATPTTGDFIYCANNHAASYSIASNLTFPGGSAGSAGITVMSVDNTAIDKYLKGASEDNTGTNDFYVSGHVTIIGVDLKGGDYVFYLVTVCSGLRLQDLTITNGGGSVDTNIYIGNDGIIVDLVDVEVASTGTSSEYFSILSGASLTWKGGSTSGASPAHLFDNLGGGGGARAFISSVDLSSFTGNIMPVLTAGTSDNVFIKLDQCRLNSGVTLPTAGTELVTRNNRFEMYNCDDSTGNAMHRLYIADGTGACRNQDNVYIDADTVWYEGAAKSSMEISTTAICNHANPFVFELPTQYIDLGDTASDKVSLDIVIDTTAITTLTDTDINIFLSYPDKTTPVIPHTINNVINPTGTGIELNKTGALINSDWTGEPASPEFYRVNLDTAGQAGEAFPVIVRVEVYKPSIAWGKLFIGSELVVGT